MGILMTIHDPNPKPESKPGEPMPEPVEPSSTPPTEPFPGPYTLPDREGDVTVTTVVPSE